MEMIVFMGLFLYMIMSARPFASARRKAWKLVVHEFLRPTISQLKVLLHASLRAARRCARQLGCRLYYEFMAWDGAVRVSDTTHANVREQGLRYDAGFAVPVLMS